ncbi:MAG: carboxypeptidase-like regulatory domain-containing protein [Flavobacteriales bacterium]|nr:carboxypeptidase-like regulatory domain-containing protein [Flavobacteriales bacterium]
MKKNILVLLLGLLAGQLKAYQISGKVTFDDQPLPGAAVHIKGTTYGVATNGKGEYFLQLEAGNYTVLCEFIGMESIERTITVSGNIEYLNFSMVESQNLLSTTTIDANSEDPAYGLLRSVIAKKDSLNREEMFKCRLYLKVSLENEDLKKSDSTNPDLTTREKVNFIESYSDIYKAYNRTKEVKKAYRNFSENQRIYDGSKSVAFGFSMGEKDPTAARKTESNDLFFTRISEGNFDFLQNLMQLPVLSQMPITSPISDNAFSVYRFKQVETFYDVSGDFIGKIRVTPKNKDAALFTGVIYISKTTKTLKSVELEINPTALMYFNNFRVIQDYDFTKDNQLIITRQEFYYESHTSKTKANYGHTYATYSDYDFDTKISARFMNEGEVVFEEESMDMSSNYWDSIRPIGLKPLEQNFVHTQDSIVQYHNSMEYLLKKDSTINDLNIWDFLIYGIVHRNSQKGTRWYISPITGALLSINYVDGWRPEVSGSFTKNWKNAKQIELSGGISYGLTNKTVKGSIGTRYLYDPKTFSRVRLYYANQYTMVNTSTSIKEYLSPRNYAQNNGYGIGYEREWINGIFSRIYLDYNTFSPYKGEVFDEWKKYFPNVSKPQDFEPFQEMVLDINTRITFRQRYEMLPHEKIIKGSKYPIVNLHYEKGIKPMLGSDVNYDFIEAQSGYNFKLFKVGQTMAYGQAGRFLNNNAVRISNLKYFRGSDRFSFSNPLKTAQTIVDTGYNTSKAYILMGMMHHFNGALLNKVPILKKTKIQTAIGTNILYLEEVNLLNTELIVGLERPFRLGQQMFRFGVYYVNGLNTETGITQRVKFGFDFLDLGSWLWRY